MLMRLAGVVTTMSGTVKGGGLLLDTSAVSSSGLPSPSVKESATSLTWLHRAAFGHRTKAPGVMLPSLLQHACVNARDRAIVCKKMARSLR